MPRRRYLFDNPDRFVTGTVGEPGNRTFFLQAREGKRILSVALEKVQVAALADRLGDLLDELEGRDVEGATEEPGIVGDTAAMDEPVNEAFRVGTLSLGWDTSDKLIVLEAREVTEADEDEDEATPMSTTRTMRTARTSSASDSRPGTPAGSSPEPSA